MSRDWPFFLTLYLAGGLLWTLWQSNSPLFRAAAVRLNASGYAWGILLAWAVGALLWPLGPIGYAAFFLWKRNKGEP